MKRILPIVTRVEKPAPVHNPFNAMPKGPLRYFIDYLTATRKKYLYSLKPKDAETLDRLLELARLAYRKFHSKDLDSRVIIPKDIPANSRKKIQDFLKTLQEQPSHSE